MEKVFDLKDRNRPGWKFLESNKILQAYAHVFDDTKDETLAVGFDVNKMFVFLATMYDRGSATRAMVNYRDRLIYSCEEAGLHQRQNSYPEWMEQIIDGHPFVDSCASRMLYVQHDNDFSYLVVLQESFYKALQELKGDSSKHKEVTSLKKLIDDEMQKINNGPLSTQKAIMMYGLIEEMSLGIKPEDHIKIFQDRGEVFNEFAQ